MEFTTVSRTAAASWIVVLALAGMAQAELMAPQMPRKSSEKAREVPPPPRMTWERKMISDNLNEGVAVFDVNKDGKPDITAGPNWYEGPEFKAHPLREVKVLNGEFMDINCEHGLDVNADGWTDVVAGSWFSDKVYWYENPGKEGLAAGKLWAQHLIAEGQHDHEGNILTDLDGDGTPELVINSWSADKPMTVIRITPGAEPKFKAVNLGGPGTGHGIAIGDINGDKRTDIMVPKGWFEQPAEQPWSTPWKFHKSNADLEHGSVPGVMVDLNGDGKNEVIIGKGHDYGLWWFEQGPVVDGEITWKRHDIDTTYSQLHSVVWADLDGDGRNEVITGKRWRGHKDGDAGSHEPMCVFRYTWDGKTFERDTIAFDDGVGTGMQIRVADMDADGKPDLVVAGKTGTYVLFNRGKAQK
jgi:hypothetical protein